MENEQLEKIKLIQLPIFKDEIKAAGIEIKQRLEDLHLESMDPTDESIQSIKKLLANLNKEEDTWKENFKVAIKPATDVIDGLKLDYKTHIEGEYSNARTILKPKVASFELAIKDVKKAAVKAYFDLLLIDHEIDWLTFEMLHLDINLSTTEKAYKTQCVEFVSRIADDLKMINQNKYAAEILVEYKRTLNASKSIMLINDRKELEKKELDRIKQIRIDRRENILRSKGFIWHDITHSFHLISDENVSISNHEIETIEDFDFEVFIQKNVQKTEPVQKLQAHTIVAPVEQPKETFAKFIVYGTPQRLIALGEFLKINGYKYENLND